jgi:hypothetical protein
MRRGVRGPIATALILAATAASAFADFAPTGSDLRISNAGPDNTTPTFAAAPEITHNAVSNEYLVVWDDDRLSDGEAEIFGQRLNGAGAEIGGDFRISNVANDVSAAAGEGFDAAVAHNPELNQYLVVWEGDGFNDEEDEIFGQLLNATGGEIGGDFRISNVGVDGNDGAELSFPDVAYDPGADAYLVVWHGENAGENDFEIYGQLVSKAGGEIGGDFQISNVGAGSVRGAFDPSLVFNPVTGEYLVVWEAEGTATDEDYDIYGQRLNSAGVEQGTNDFKISSMDAAAMPDAYYAKAAADPATGEMLVVWQSGDVTKDQVEIFGQRLSPAGGELGGDFQISNATAVAPDRAAAGGTVAFSQKSSEYLVTWVTNALKADQVEIYGQRLSTGGAELGSEFRVSRLSEAGPDRDVYYADEDSSEMAYNPNDNNFLTVWSADELAVDDENEIFGRLIAEPAPGSGGPPGGGQGATATPKCKGKPATKFGTARKDVLKGTPKADVIVGLGGNDKLSGRGGNDLICGGQGKDKLKGGGGKDRLYGEGGKDVLRGGPGKDVVNGGPGKDSQKQ